MMAMQVVSGYKLTIVVMTMQVIGDKTLTMVMITIYR